MGWPVTKGTVTRGMVTSMVTRSTATKGAHLELVRKLAREGVPQFGLRNQQQYMKMVLDVFLLDCSGSAVPYR